MDLNQKLDLANSFFEFGGAFAKMLDVKALLKSKMYSGFSPASTIFFSSWGFFNIIYYPHLGQMASALGGLSICVINLLYLALLVKYRKNN